MKRTLPARYRAALGQRIRTLRKAQNFTQQHLANLADIELSTLNRAELGKAALSVTNLVAISEALHIHPKELWDFPWPPTPIQEIKQTGK